MTTVYYISHPDVIVDPAVPIPHWDLSEGGQQRLGVLLTQPWIEKVQSVFCSDEQKAKTTARRIAQHLGLQAIILEALGEIDRSSTGYLQQAELRQVVEAFYADPEKSSRGWERAIDAQRRVIHAIQYALSLTPPDSTTAVVGHGTVGTLFLSHLKGTRISRADAPPGQGCYFAFDRDTRQLTHSWKPIDQVE